MSKWRMGDWLLASVDHWEFKKLSETKFMNEWISLNERFPSNLSDVLFYYETTDTGKKGITIGHYDKGSWHICYLHHSIRLNDLIKVTHWMELPRFPNE